MSEKTEWEMTHLCRRNNEPDCEYFLQTDTDALLDGKNLSKCCYYCTSENKVRKIGSVGSWTGLSPKFCPKRKCLSDEKGNAVTASKLTYKDVLLEHYPNFDVDRFEDFIVEACIEYYFESAFPCSKRCKSHWESECLSECRDEIEDCELERVKKYLKTALDNTAEPAEKKQELIPAPAEEKPAVFDYSDLDTDTADKPREAAEKVIAAKKTISLKLHSKSKLHMTCLQTTKAVHSVHGAKV